ncbi:E3 ubiquitin-protein ligase HERC2 [Histomonas meleagridis]|uniref:E3 ubiquitin-protein ligase HERC2 n=1 Tax=Histomonas meleagridis TaxID=135588 RepID=UPI00355A9D0C|nr:E3 ubiquitin-protein ligase HERC2 [Histomonas meleagridis]KAH0806601.1 E3 ubiquitin-protein ligase HERC2 [Histomonas meleagridis]
MDYVRNFTVESEFSTISQLTFTVKNSYGEIVELFKDGKITQVTFDNRLKYCELCERFRINEFTDVLSSVREGMKLIFGNSLSALVPWELRTLLCGDFDIPINELKKQCQIFNPVINGVNYEEMLFEALQRFSPEERMLFIKFGSGRMSLPPPGMQWSSMLRIVFQEKMRPDNTLPRAATCSSEITIPNYSSIDVLEKNLRIAVTFSVDIDQDFDPDLEDVVELE